MSATTPIDTERLRALLAASTPGPWASAPWHQETILPKRWIEGDNDEAPLEDRGPFGSFYASGPANAALVAEALTALPALLDEVDRLRGEAGDAHTVGYVVLSDHVEMHAGQVAERAIDLNWDGELHKRREDAEESASERDTSPEWRESWMEVATVLLPRDRMPDWWHALPEPPPAEHKVVDLMAALEQSVNDAKAARKAKGGES